MLMSNVSSSLVLFGDTPIGKIMLCLHRDKVKILTFHNLTLHVLVAIQNFTNLYYFRHFGHRKRKWQ